MNGKFKAEVGRLILIGALAYCVLVTIGLMISTIFRCEPSQPVRDMIVIILTWVTTKAGTVVDHQYGGSAGSDAKTNFMMQEVQDAKKPVVTLPVERDSVVDDLERAAGLRRKPGDDPELPGTS